MPTHDEKHWEDVKNHLGGRKPKDIGHFREISDVVRIKQRKKPYADSTLKRIAEQKGLVEKGSVWRYSHEQYWKEASDVLGHEPETYEELRDTLNKRKNKLSERTILGVATKKGLDVKGELWRYSLKQYWDEAVGVLGHEPETYEELRDTLNKRKNKLSEGTIFSVATRHRLKNCRKQMIGTLFKEIGQKNTKQEVINELDKSGIEQSIVDQIAKKCLRDVHASELVQRMKGREITPEMLNRLKGVLKRMGLEDKKTNDLIEKHLGK